MACSLTSRGKPKENIVNAADVYIINTEDNQLLDRDEITKIIEAVHELYEGKTITEKDSRKKVEEIMKTYDKNKSGTIPKTELVEALSIIQNDIKVAEYFNQRSFECQVEPDEEDENKISEFLKNRQTFYDD